MVFTMPIFNLKKKFNLWQTLTRMQLLFVELPEQFNHHSTGYPHFMG
jgi:hypothetical protein